LCPAALSACLWDYDTLKMERSRFPDTLELIAGKFLRHGYEFYKWRVRDRLAKLEAGSGDEFALRDDLAVAYDKTGEHQKAIETMLISLAKKPDRYETQANLGTFYIHSGQLEKGLEHIDRAIQINPDAHFGREKYQKNIVEYVIKTKKDGGELLPLAKDSSSSARTGFVAFLKNDGKDNNKPLPEQELQAALKGIQGMMKFGKHDSPILLEALGDLLLYGSGFDTKDAKRLASRAYLKASYEVSDPKQREEYREKARSALRFQTRDPGTTDQLGLEEVEQSFQNELADARDWYAELSDKERSWIRAGENPEAEFDRLYNEEPRVDSPEEAAPEPMPLHQKLMIRLGIILGGTVIGVAFASWLCVYFFKYRRKSRPFLPLS
jgi:tetratricopeptide (TPR) repeat protein